MVEKKKRRRKTFRFRNLILLFIVFYIIAALFNQRKLMKDLKVKKNQLEDEIVTLEKDVLGLKDEIDNSDSLEFIEKIARDELGMVKPREIIYIDKKKAKDSKFDVFKKESN